MDPVNGRRLLAEVEEMSLEEILDAIRTAFDPRAIRTSSSKRALRLTHIEALDTLITARHASAPQASTATICGRALPLLYKLIAGLVSPPHRHAVLVIDIDARFDATRLDCLPEDLGHVYVLRPPQGADLRAVVANARDWLVYGRGSGSASAARCLWGSVLVGGSGEGAAAAGIDIAASWRGWLRVEPTAVPAFPQGSNVAGALASREARQQTVDEGGWTATSEWGSFVFADSAGTPTQEQKEEEEEQEFREEEPS
ncbi:hypothetical protein B0I35DRAFT_162760 [Stachybotrys elegans]|uniref:Uncharacterized protein n=1 Tax=Stachybotrys elegans TaxID=80388 RepID=A0A8K0T0Q9_9HYPO|nr:hypothetical protein B0I35DRAFT_162760 [Stachybotrys elegans]